MRTGRASKTAEHNALFRVLETKRRDGRLFEDRVSERLLSWPFRVVATAATSGMVRTGVVRFIDARWPGVRSSVVARTCLIDEAVADLVGGVDQIVLLGAGYDTRAFRLACLNDVSVFEVDHPDTQRAKRTRLQRAKIELEGVHFVATDFRESDLDGVMAEARFDRSAPTLFVWEGVTNYLDAASVDATLRWCGAAPAGSALIFTYIDRRALDDPSQFVGAERVFRTLGRTGERMTFGMAPDCLGSYLQGLGLTLVSDIGAADYRKRYFGDAADAVKGHEFYRVAIARRVA